jgi:hypothetical protein
LRKANEQSAKEKSELQQAMDKMLKEALAKQNAALEADRAARQSALSGSSKPAAPELKAVPAPLPPPPVSTLAQTTQRLPSGPANQFVETASSDRPAQFAMLTNPNQQKSAQQNAQTLLNDKLPVPGDEWEYQADYLTTENERSGQRVKAVVLNGGSEEFFVNGNPPTTVLKATGSVCFTKRTFCFAVLVR